ncbi:3-hydroxyacyl-ACP dehydratase FabZ family protein [Flavobacterium pallidum]|uniref:Hydroxymyristoyl-ACP dehydratase n=1 Tax=Flavobacterium pallidum TaxID=2172098 RepID=A0A2S1SLJ7_9FLAO|nr:beta-hydroxyacyl-ACP dehydratase [Flavobacterium pallidum]AWI27278.1 hydroxymyristoyl-ACP dehydratase [Flavobacterium pallidum]
MDIETIPALLPYAKPFLFVDGLSHIDENSVEGHYTFTEDHDFFKGHFKGNPVVPGVILTETMAQIGLVCMGIYLSNDTLDKTTVIALTSTEIEFIIPVYPKEKIVVVSEKIYFRFGKLKCRVKMLNAHDKVVCEGTIAGMITSKS